MHTACENDDKCNCVCGVSWCGYENAFESTDEGAGRGGGPLSIRKVAACNLQVAQEPDTLEVRLPVERAFLCASQ